VAVASAGQYASLHLAPDRQPHQHPNSQFFTGRMPFLPPNQQRQSTEGNIKKRCTRKKIGSLFLPHGVHVIEPIAFTQGGTKA